LRNAVIGLAVVCALAVILSAIVWRRARTPVPKEKSPVSPASSDSSREGVDAFFPFRVGSRWIYLVRGEQQEGSGRKGRTESGQGKYSDEVTSVRAISPDVRLVELVRHGIAPGYAFCSADERQSGQWRFWYVVMGRKIFSRCSQEDAAALVSTHSQSPAPEDAGDDPEFLLPFKVGASWGPDPSAPKREDKFYQWNVDAKVDVTVPAGSFRDCYELSFKTLPDDEERWICAGVDLIADEYTHHGTTDHYRIELQSFTSGPEQAK